jgi:hypothetical protein
MLLRKHLFLPISFPAFLFSCRLVRMSHSAVSQSRRLHFILLPAPSQPCGHRQVLRYPVPITHLVLLILPSFASSQLLFFFPHRTLHHTTRTFTSATLRCPNPVCYNLLAFPPYLDSPWDRFTISSTHLRRESIGFRSHYVLLSSCLSILFPLLLPSRPIFTLLPPTRRFCPRYSLPPNG